MNRQRRHIEAVAIGASAGGVQALLRLLGELPAGYALPVMVVIHMPRGQDSRLAEIFSAHLHMAVSQANDKEYIQPAHVYFAPPNYHLSVEEDRSFSLSCEAPAHYSRPAIDYLLESAADTYGAGLAAILLTGASADGAQGMAQVKARGGLTLIQDPAEAEVAIMPQAAIDLCQPDDILTLQDLAKALLAMEKC